MILRPARPEDAAACAEILNAWIDATDWLPRCHGEETVAPHLAEVIADRRVWIAEGPVGIAGFLALNAQGLVTDFYLDAAARGHGLGHRMLAEAKSARPQGLRLWCFQANTQARAFYAREGFVEINRTDGENEEGLPDLLLEWRPAATDHTSARAERLDKSVAR